MFIRVKTFILNKIGKNFRKIYINKRDRAELKNKDFTIISQNCTGGIISNDLGLKFRSPTINLFIGAEDFVKFLERFDYYLECEMQESSIENITYPIGELNDIKIHFIHYKSFKEAREKWELRKERIDRNNMFVIMSERDGCSKEIVRRFDELPFKNKVIFTCKEYCYKSSVFIKEFEGQKEVGVVTNMKNIFGKRIYEDYFNCIKWLNDGK